MELPTEGRVTWCYSVLRRPFNFGLSTFFMANTLALQ